MQRTIIQSEGDFPFRFYIEKAIPTDEGDEMVITGIASTLNVDHDKERMSKEAMSSMANIINEKSVPLRLEHQKSNEAVIGDVYKAWIDERNQLWIKARLSKAHPATSILYKSLKEGVKLGLSVGGRVKKATREFVESVGKMVKTFYDVALDEVSVTQRPANYDAWLFAKSYIQKGEDSASFKDSNVYGQFLFENPQLDYMQVFAKSVPTTSWVIKTLEDNKINTMKEEEMKPKEEVIVPAEKEMEEKPVVVPTEKEAPTEAPAEEEPKFATQSEVDTLKSIVSKGFESLMTIMSKLQKGADMPFEKPEDKKGEEKPAEKAEDEKKPEGGKPDAESEETPKGEEYELKAMKSMVAKLETMNKAMGDEEAEEATETPAEQAEEEATGEETTKSQHSEIEKFSAIVSDTISKMQRRMAKRGISAPNFEKSMAESIRNNPSIQSIIKEMIDAAPSVRKSAAFGSPFMITKDGKRFSLQAKEVGNPEIAKSEKPKSFKEAYMSTYAENGR